MLLTTCDHPFKPIILGGKGLHALKGKKKFLKKMKQVISREALNSVKVLRSCGCKMRTTFIQSITEYV